MLAARQDIVEAGLAPARARAVHRAILVHGNPLGEPGIRLAQLGERFALPSAAEVLLFLGCNTAYRQPEIALAALAVLRVARVPFTILSDERCCGEPQRVLGFTDAARETAQATAMAIAHSGARTVVFLCPTCLRMVKRDYPQWGLGIPGEAELLHLTEYLIRLLQTGRLKLTLPVEKAVAYHDPCALGRGLGIYEAPRLVLGHVPGLRLLELQHNRNRAVCCGAGGALDAIDQRLAIAAGIKALDLALAAGAEILATACATCKQSFLRHTSHLNELEILDVVELIARALFDDEGEGFYKTCSPPHLVPPGRERQVKG